MEICYLTSKITSIFSNPKAEEEKNKTLDNIFQLGIETLFSAEPFGKNNLDINPNNFTDSQIQYIGEIFNLAQM